jgi:hypothetical protein
MSQPLFKGCLAGPLRFGDRVQPQSAIGDHGVGVARYSAHPCPGDQYRGYRETSGSHSEGADCCDSCCRRCVLWEGRLEVPLKRRSHPWAIDAPSSTDVGIEQRLIARHGPTRSSRLSDFLLDDETIPTRPMRGVSHRRKAAVRATVSAPRRSNQLAARDFVEHCRLRTSLPRSGARTV